MPFNIHSLLPSLFIREVDCTDKMNILKSDLQKSISTIPFPEFMALQTLTAPMNVLELKHILPHLGGFFPSFPQYL